MKTRLKDVIRRAGELTYKVQHKGPNRARRRQIEAAAKREEAREKKERLLRNAKKREKRKKRKLQKQRRKQRWKGKAT
jgi:hypothetical protein